MTTVAFCGLGLMGEPMARRLIEAGYDVNAWNRTPSKARALQGARPAGSPAEAASGSEVVITMLATPEAVREVVAGDRGVAEGMGADATLIEMSTIGPAAVHALRGHLPANSAMLDAPVVGSVPQARDGQLKVLTGGERDVVERWRELLEVFGTVTHVGELGHGAAMKLVVNSTLGALMTALGEALALAKGLGLDRDKVFDVLVDSALGVTARGKRSNIERGSYPPNFKLELVAKDMRLVTEAAEDAGVDLRVARAARQWIEEAEAAGFSKLDYSAVVAQIMGEPASGSGTG
ncbi:MAG: NAD(P)-dependent oxidoreductase [Actinomycetota bacterium]|nr:NAD(P)-dependent oxidoreductase [Actinomycetota bacterium]